MNGVCECGHETGDHNGPMGDCQARCLCDSCPDDTGNDCWCAGFKAKEATMFLPAERAYFGPDLARVNSIIRQHCGPYEAREEFADMPTTPRWPCTATAPASTSSSGKSLATPVTTTARQQVDRRGDYRR